MNSLLRNKILLLLPVFLLTSVVFFATTQTSYAQSIGNVSYDGVDISSSPSNPAPGDKVSVSVQSFSMDLNSAAISWSVDGKVLTKGTGMTSLEINAPAIGKSTRIIATVSTLAGAIIRKTVTIRSGDVDLVWETSGYTPTLYRGKVPFVYQNNVTFTALPHFVDKNGKAIDPRGLIYKWSDGSDVLGDQSGYGKQSITIRGSIIPRTLDISVVATSPDDQTINGQSEVSLDAVAPSITFYQDDPLYGVLYNNAIGSTFRLSHNELKVVSAPYGFDIPTTNNLATPSPLVYTWDINNVDQANLTTSRSVVLHVNAGQQGSSNISLSLANTANNILQGATASFNAIFNTKSQSTTKTTVF